MTWKAAEGTSQPKAKEGASQEAAPECGMSLLN